VQLSRGLLSGLLCAIAGIAVAQPAPPQPAPTEQQILGNIISQQTQENARLNVQIFHMQQALQATQGNLDKAKAEIEALKSKLPKE